MTVHELGPFRQALQSYGEAMEAAIRSVDGPLDGARPANEPCTEECDHFLGEGHPPCRCYGDPDGTTRPGW